MSEYPKGAISSKNQLREGLFIYGVWAGENPISISKQKVRFVDSKGFGFAPSLRNITYYNFIGWNIECRSNSLPNDFLFTNYWDAYAWMLKVKANVSAH